MFYERIPAFLLSHTLILKIVQTLVGRYVRVDFEIIGEIKQIETISRGSSTKMNPKDNQFPQFGLCLNNEGYPASLEVGKVYRVIQDDEAASHGYIRVIDESGEDYAYTASRFHLIHTIYRRCIS